MSIPPSLFKALRARLKATWMAGDFGRIAKYSGPAAEQFMARRATKPGVRVLGVACGTRQSGDPRRQSRCEGYIRLPVGLLDSDAVRS
jgi:hypothetical protein